MVEFLQCSKNNSLVTGVHGDRSYEYPTIASQPSLPTATYDTVASEIETKAHIYSELSW